jgi:hypothetical protein
MSEVVFETAADVTGTSVQVEVQMPDRRVQVLFGRSMRCSFLLLWLSDPAEIADLAENLAKAGQQLARELAAEDRL